MNSYKDRIKLSKQSNISESQLEALVNDRSLLVRRSVMLRKDLSFDFKKKLFLLDNAYFAKKVELTKDISEFIMQQIDDVIKSKSTYTHCDDDLIYSKSACDVILIKNFLTNPSAHISVLNKNIDKYFKLIQKDKFLQLNCIERHVFYYSLCNKNVLPSSINNIINELSYTKDYSELFLVLVAFKRVEQDGFDKIMKISRNYLSHLKENTGKYVAYEMAYSRYDELIDTIGCCNFNLSSEDFINFFIEISDLTDCGDVRAALYSSRDELISKIMKKISKDNLNLLSNEIKSGHFDRPLFGLLISSKGTKLSLLKLMLNELLTYSKGKYSIDYLFLASNENIDKKIINTLIQTNFHQVLTCLAQNNSVNLENLLVIMNILKTNFPDNADQLFDSKLFKSKIEKLFKQNENIFLKNLDLLTR